MNLMNNEDFPGISPINFFQIIHDCPYYSESLIKKPSSQLPLTSAFCNETPFANVAIFWDEEGLHVYVDVSQAFKESAFPDITQGDSIELFIDTRDIKTSGYNTRFCHHFFFLPEALPEHQAGEITHFRTEESHPLADPELFEIKSTFHKKSYEMEIFIPKECLYGYDPSQFHRLGFTYRINRPDGPPQHFSATSDDFNIEEQPSLWGTLRLIK